MPENSNQQYLCYDILDQHWNVALRTTISTFRQRSSELFWQAWQRFDGYRKERPHHGYSDTEVLLFFYNRIRECHQDELDDDAFLEFSVQDTQVAYSLIEDLAASSYAESKNPTPQPSESQTTLVEIRELFSNGILEITKIVEEIKEIVPTKDKLDSILTTSDMQMRMAGNQVDEELVVTEKQQGILPMRTIVENEIERVDSGLAVTEAESAEDIKLQPLPERADTLEEEFSAAESKEVMLEFIEEPPPVATVQTTPVIQEEVTTVDEATLQSQDVQELEDTPRFEQCVETEDMSPAETCHDSFNADTEDFSLVETADISSTKNQTSHGFCAEDIIESAAMPRTGPDKPEDHKVSQFDRIMHHDIEDSLARIWSMSKKGNGFPWDDGISRELKLVDDLGLDSRKFWVSNLLEPSLIVDQNKSRFLIRDAGKAAGIPRTGPDIQGFNEFDQSQFLSFAGEGGCITYCDLIGSMTRPPEILLNVPVLC